LKLSAIAAERTEAPGGSGATVASGKNPLGASRWITTLSVFLFPKSRQTASGVISWGY